MLTPHVPDWPMPTDNAADGTLDNLDASEIATVDNRAVDNRAVDNRAVDNRAVDNRAVDNRAVDNEPVLAYILGDGTLQRRIADELGLRVIARPDADDPTPLVVLAERAPDVQAIAQARSWAPIRAVIAWGLPESALLRLLDLELPTMIGLPERDQLRRAVQRGEDGLDRASERRRAGRLAAVEAALSTRGRADVALSQLRTGE